MAHYNTADLAMPTTPERNEAMARVVRLAGAPHWIAGENTQEAEVEWPDTGAMSVGHFHGPLEHNFTAWHKTEPDDDDGLKHAEECVFMGRDGTWHDFACEPKNPSRRHSVKTGRPATSGPLLHWGASSEAIVHRIYPMCQMVFHGSKASEVSVGWLDHKDIIQSQALDEHDFRSHIKVLDWHTPMWDRHFAEEENEYEALLSSDDLPEPHEYSSPAMDASPPSSSDGAHGSDL